MVVFLLCVIVAILLLGADIVFGLGFIALTMVAALLALEAVGLSTSDTLIIAGVVAVLAILFKAFHAWIDRTWPTKIPMVYTGRATTIQQEILSPDSDALEKAARRRRALQFLQQYPNRS